MANPHDNFASNNKMIPPLEEQNNQNIDHDQYEENDEEEDQEETTLLLSSSHYSLCGNCFQGLIPSRWRGGRLRRRSDKAAGPRRHLLHEEAEDRVSWLVKSVKKVKEVSELLAGPKWKNFIRRFSRSCDEIINSKKRRVQFHYDPQSYALNFDDREADNGTYLEISGRFADPLGINKG